VKSFRGSILVAAVLVSALVVVASPAFATPNITASSGTNNADVHRAGAVSPFITPSTNTKSSFTGRATRPMLSIPALGEILECRTGFASGYVTVTHTQARITSLSFGDGARGTCTLRGTAAGTIDRDVVHCTATSNNPWLLHVQARGPNNSWSGTVNIPPGGSSCTFIFTAPTLGLSCILVVDANQSVDNAALYTNVTSSLELVRAQVRVTIRENRDRRCPAPFPGSYTATFDAVYTIRADTPTDATPTITAGS
jgi:hypothetical protein